MLYSIWFIGFIGKELGIKVPLLSNKTYSISIYVKNKTYFLQKRRSPRWNPISTPGVEVHPQLNHKRHPSKWMVHWWWMLVHSDLLSLYLSLLSTFANSLLPSFLSNSFEGRKGQGSHNCVLFVGQMQFKALFIRGALIWLPSTKLTGFQSFI
jgi:hypothetical protein